METALDVRQDFHHPGRATITGYNRGSSLTLLAEIEMMK